MPVSHLFFLETTDMFSITRYNFLFYYTHVLFNNTILRKMPDALFFIFYGTLKRYATLLISVNITKSNSLPDNMAISLGTKGSMDIRRGEKKHINLFCKFD